MVVVFQSLFVLAGLVILILLAFRMKGDKAIVRMPENYKELLEDYVQFYRELDEADKRLFEKRIEKFLIDVKVTGVNAEVEDIDRLLIAAGATIARWRKGPVNNSFTIAGYRKYIARGAMINIKAVVSQCAGGYTCQRPAFVIAGCIAEH